MNQSYAWGEAQHVRPPSVKQWLGILLILSIPIVNIIVLLVWAFGDAADPVRRNFSRAYLILIAVVFAVMILIFLAIGGLVAFSEGGMYT